MADTGDEESQNDTQQVSVSHVDKRHTPRRGQFRVYVKYARNLPDTDGWFNRPDPYVKITAVKENGQRYSKVTHKISGNQNPNWYTWLDWQNNGCEWTHFDVEVWDEDAGRDDLMFPRGTFDIEPGTHTDQKHCVQNSCSGYLQFNYYLLPDTNSCAVNPCRNGGTCIEGCRTFTCQCPGSYSGSRCQHRLGRLRIYARYGTGLQDRDRLGRSDPYMEVVAVDSDGRSTRKTTSTDRGDQSPEWYSYLDFGVHQWKRFSVRLYDSDPGSDDALSNSQTIYLPSRSISVTNVYHSAYGGGSAYFDYQFN